MMRTIASYREYDRHHRSPMTQAEDHANDLRSLGFRASVSCRDLKSGQTVFTVRSNIPANDPRA